MNAMAARALVSLQNRKTACFRLRGISMRILPLSLLSMSVLLAAGCGSVDYKDTNSAVDTNPLCTSQPDRPGEPVSKDCERSSSVNWNTKTEDDKPIEFGKKK
jgi:hypothetical protein